MREEASSEWESLLQVAERMVLSHPVVRDAFVYEDADEEGNFIAQAMVLPPRPIKFVRIFVSIDQEMKERG